jgi:hypothetical protein
MAPTAPSIAAIIHCRNTPNGNHTSHIGCRGFDLLGSEQGGGGFYGWVQLFSDCEEGQAPASPADMFWGMCLGYILGAADALQSAHKICIPKGVEAAQVLDVVKLYIRQHPEVRHYSASHLVVTALNEKFSCN